MLKIQDMKKGVVTLSRKTSGRLTTWPQLRFSIVGELLARPPEKGKLRQELERLASRCYTHPTKGTLVKFGVSTIERWYYHALRSSDPIEALGRKIRSDTGRTKAMSPQLLDILRQQYEDYPNWSYQLHTDNLVALLEERPELGEVPSYSTVLRRMKARGWYKRRSPQSGSPGKKRAAERLEKWEVRSYESSYVNALWHLDFHESRRVVDVNGQWHTPKALCVLDDCSRSCAHMQWYLRESAESLNHGLEQAFHKRGLPRGLMSDNGSSMLALETQNGLLRLGIKHERTLAYSPYQNGKQEAFWAQLEGRLMAMISRIKPLTLAFLNKVTQAWVELEYNRRLHNEIGVSPLERLLKGPDVSRPSPDSEALRLAFTVEEKRAQRQSDGTIQIKGVRFEIPSRFRHFRRLHVRYQTWDLSMAYLVDEKTGSLLGRIYPQDKTKNASGWRRTIEPSSDRIPSTPQMDSNPIPPLLRKILADYAATGLPPAYLPKEESALPNTDAIKEDRNE